MIYTLASPGNPIEIWEAYSGLVCWKKFQVKLLDFLRMVQVHTLEKVKPT